MGAFARLVVCAAAATAAACVPLPVRHAPAARGRVVDASGAPVSGALVVVRFDGFYDEGLPRHEAFAWRTVRSGPDGRFRAGPAFAPGVEPWPWLRTRARARVVLAAGRLCAEDQDLAADGTSRIVLAPARDEEERRTSCPPLAGWPAGARDYAAAWRDLYAEAGPDGSPTAAEDELSRAAASRRSFGFGANCAGPVLELSLAPDGSRAALLVARGSEVEVQLVDVAADPFPAPRSLTRLAAHPLPSLTWTSAGSLTLGAGALAAEAARPELLAGPLDGPPGTGAAATTLASGVLWSPEQPPASLAAESSVELPALEAADRHDGAGLRWAGRSFRELHEVDAASGLPRDLLRVASAEGDVVTLPLPGEPCGAEGRFGRPQLRMSADGARGLDLRFVEGACRALAIDLASGTWQTLDAGDGPGVCSEQRAVPASGLAAALPGYLRELRQTLGEAGLDPAGAFVLHVDPDGATRLEAQAPDGTRRVLEAPPFPLATPLRRIEVATVGGGG